MLVKEIMTTGLKTVKADTSVKDVAMIMCLQKISGLPVVDDDGKMIGIISEKDVLQRMFPDMGEAMSMEAKPNFEEMEQNYNDALGLSSKDIMTKAVSTVEPDMPCLKAASLMWLKKVRRIPVTEDGKLVGIISIGDVHKAIFQQHLVNNVA